MSKTKSAMAVELAMFPTLVSYARISSKRQLSGTGLAQQKDGEVLAKLSEKLGLPIDDRSFVDAGRSGFHGHHLDHDFGRLLHMIDTQEIAKGSCIVVSSLDRISRQAVNHATELFLSVINRGVNIYTTIDEKLYSENSPNLMGELVISVIILAQAHEESLKKSERTLGNVRALLKKIHNNELSEDGYPLAINSMGKHPWYIDATKGDIRPHATLYPAAQDLVGLIKKGWGTTACLEYMREKYPEKKWTESQFRKFHLSEAMFGRRTFELPEKKHVLEDYYPPLMTENEYRAFVQMRKERTAPREREGIVPLLTGVGLFKCADCGSTISTGRRLYKGEEKRQYFCLGKSRHKICKTGVNATCTPIDEAVVRMAKDILWANHKEPDAAEATKAALTNELAAIESHLKEAKDMLEAEGKLPRMMMRQVMDWETRQEEIEEELSHLAVPMTTTEKLAADWKEVSVNLVHDTYNKEDRQLFRELAKRSFKGIAVRRLPEYMSCEIHLVTMAGEYRFAKVIRGEVVYRTLRTDEKHDAVLHSLQKQYGNADHEVI